MLSWHTFTVLSYLCDVEFFQPIQEWREYGGHLWLECMTCQNRNKNLNKPQYKACNHLAFLCAVESFPLFKKGFRNEWLSYCSNVTKHPSVLPLGFPRGLCVRFISGVNNSTVMTGDREGERARGNAVSMFHRGFVINHPDSSCSDMKCC